MRWSFVLLILGIIVLNLGTRTLAADINSREKIVKSISFQVENEVEKVFVQLNAQFIPTVAAIEGDNPRIYMDFQDIVEWSGPSTIPVNGQLVKQIRVHLHHDKKVLRIVLDLTPSLDCTVNPVYYNAENIYCLEISEVK
jgi:hypothetical protein